MTSGPRKREKASARRFPSEASDGESSDLTRVATQATAPGRGAIGTLFLAGVDMLDRIQPLFRPAGRAIEARNLGADAGLIHFGHWNHSMNPDIEPGHVARWEEVVVIVGATLNGDNPERPARRQIQQVEVQCHGGETAARSILRSLEVNGFRIVPWTEWQGETRSLFDREYTRALASAATQRTALLLLAQGAHATGHNSIAPVSQSTAQSIAEPVASLVGQIPLEIQCITDLLTGLAADSIAIESASRRIQTLLQNAVIGQHLVVPWQVAVVGEPNVGKSSLVNALVGFERAIVYDQPGTTRDELETTTAFAGWPVQIWDTAGLRETKDAIETQGIARTTARLNHVDLVIHVLDARLGLDGQSAGERRGLIDAAADSRQSKVVNVWNKIDLDPAARIPTDGVAISATEKTGLADLKRRVVDALVPFSPDATTPLLFTPRQTRLAEQALTWLERDEVDRAVTTLEAIVT